MFFALFQRKITTELLKLLHYNLFSIFAEWKIKELTDFFYQDLYIHSFPILPYLCASYLQTSSLLAGDNNLTEEERKHFCQEILDFAKQPSETEGKI